MTPCSALAVYTGQTNTMAPANNITIGVVCEYYGAAIRAGKTILKHVVPFTLIPQKFRNTRLFEKWFINRVHIKLFAVGRPPIIFNFETTIIGMLSCIYYHASYQLVVSITTLKL